MIYVEWSWNIIDTFIFTVWPDLAELWASACTITRLTCDWVILSPEIRPTCLPDFIDTLISLIWCNLTDILASTWVILFGQTVSACSPDSIDTLISLIWPNFAHAHKKYCKCILTSVLGCLFVHTNLSHKKLVQMILWIPLSPWSHPIWLR